MSDDSSMKTPPFQFTLRTLLLFIVMSAVALGMIMWLGTAGVALIAVFGFGAMLTGTLVTSVVRDRRRDG